jgi:YkoY family integral membrane protein
MYGLTASDGVLILSVIILDGLLSIDNILGNAAQARRLPFEKRRAVLALGTLFALVFRLVALTGASTILRFPIIKLIGAGWLFYLVALHLKGSPGVDSGNSRQRSKVSRSMLGVALAIGISDMVFSIENVIAAVGFSTKFSVVVAGVAGSIVIMMFAAQAVSKLMERYGGLERAAYVIIGFIGLTMVASDAYRVFPFLPHGEMPAWAKFAVTLLVVLLPIITEEVKRFRSGLDLDV